MIRVLAGIAALAWPAGLLLVLGRSHGWAARLIDELDHGIFGGQP